MRTVLAAVATFVLTTLFWFSVPTVSQIIKHSFDKTDDNSQATGLLVPPEIAEESDSKDKSTDEEIAKYEKRIKELESQLKKANAARPTSSSSSSTKAVTASTSVTDSTTTETKALSIVGTWVYADPQTSEEREYQLIFNAYGAFKYYNTKAGYTLRDSDYSITGNTLKIGYYTGKFVLSNVNGIDYLEISGIKDYAGKLKRKK